MTWNTGKGGLTVRWSYVVESSSLSAGRSSPVVLGPQEFLAFPTRSFTQDFSYTANINYGCRQASTPTTAVEFSGENMS